MNHTDECLRLCGANRQHVLKARPSALVTVLDEQAVLLTCLQAHIARWIAEMAVPQFLRQDMTVSVNVETGRRDRALAVPNDALLNNQSGSTVFVATDGRVSRRPVSLGLRGVAMTEVTDGLAEGDRVLADAASLDLADGARVRVQLQPAPATDSAPDTRRELPVSLD